MPNNPHLTEYCAQTRDIINVTVSMCVMPRSLIVTQRVPQWLTCRQQMSMHQWSVMLISIHVTQAVVATKVTETTMMEMIIRISVMTRSISMSQEVPMRRATLTHSRTTRRGNVYRYGPIVTWRNTAAIPMAYA